MNITLYSGLSSENAPSMGRYTDSLVRLLRQRYRQTKRVTVYKAPSTIPGLIRGSRRATSTLSDFFRYVIQPTMVNQASGDINHIIQHIDGHLVRAIGPERTVVTCHDLNPLEVEGTYRHFLSRNTGKRLFEYAVSQMIRARKVVAVSEHTKEDLIKYTGCDPAKIEVVYPGVENRFDKIQSNGRLDGVRNKYAISKTSKHILHVGHSGNYKNIEGLLEIFTRIVSVRDEDIKLIRIGADFSAAQKEIIDKHRLNGQIIQVRFVPETELVAIYNLVDILLYPSLHEGFGFPVLEAMACGTPVVVSNRASLPEIAASAGIVRDVEDHEGMAEAVNSVLDNGELRASMSDKGMQRAKNFTWDKYVRETFDIYQEIYSELPLA